MKKAIIIFAAVILGILTSCSAPATLRQIGEPDPALTGTWINRHETDDKNGRSEYYDRVTFFDDGTFAQYGFVKMEMKQQASPAYIEISFHGVGIYGVIGSDINLCFTPSKSGSKLDRFDVSTDKSISAGRAGATKFILKSVLIKPLMQDIRKSLKEGQIYHIDSISPSALSMTRLDAEDAKSETYLKQNGNQ